MNPLSAAELKRRGLAAIEEGLRRGPLHLIKRNKLAAVVVSAKDYARLFPGAGVKQRGMTAVQWLLKQPSTGVKSREQLDESLHAERDGWGLIVFFDASALIYLGTRFLRRSRPSM